MNITKAPDIQYKDRPTSILHGVSKIGWAMDTQSSRLMAGLGISDGNETTFKTLNYEEIIYVISGMFGAEIDGVVHQAHAGDVIHIAAGSTVRYVSHDARIFFAITHPTTD
ncbi:hypothetical protein GLGCALEP_01966 [Pseudomonas sp. MM221]|nr:hypothetical protein DBADOPDK_01916 [Pseudomonas sp. MM223]CAI3798403.1 hypothetical protein GLGCALEP_01966 [Pseudomonas sp. MM221]